ncbi:MAG: 16S rRNA (guanine(527)-N(7))-methyltransferase RsmG [Arenimonas sp.]
MHALEHLRPELNAGLAAFELSDEILAEKLLDYLALLDKWNKAYNLTAIRDVHEMLIKHVLDSLVMHSFVESGTLADLGTGPGLPGIPLALAKPGLQVSLVESNGKKCRFLREAVRSLGLKNARVIESRAEAVPESGQYDLLTARALDRLAGIIEVGGHLLKPGGKLLAMKGIQPEEEIAELPTGWQFESSHRLQVPGLAGERHLVIVASSLSNPHN